jgi:GDP-D-mannose 3',5'-epimerase
VDVAVTGAAGFIGSNMVKRLVSQGHRVMAIDHAEPTDPSRQAAWALAEEQQVINLATMRPLLSGVQVLYHFAADMGGVGYFHTHDFWPYLNNSRIDFHVLEALIGAQVPRAFVASSACVYPTELQMKPGNAPLLTENLIEQGTPDQMYGREKLMLLRLAERCPTDVRVGILHTVYGVGQEREGERMKFPTAIATKTLAARNTGTVEIWGNGQQLRSYLWIDDALVKIEALTMAPQNVGPTNIGYQGAISVRDVASLCAEIVGVQPEYHYTDDKPSGVLSRDCGNEKFWQHFGRMEPTGYREGFTKLLEWLEN